MIILPYFVIVLAIFVLGLITGGLSNITSGGAGVLTIYVLTNFSGIVLQAATGTVLAASAVFVLIGVVSFLRQGRVDIRLGVVVGLSGVAGAFLAARWASTVESSSLERIFGGFTLALAVYTSYLFISEWRRNKRGESATDSNISKISTGSKAKNLVQLATTPSTSRFVGMSPAALSVQITKGVLIGITTGLFGVGLASLSVVLFLLLFKLDTKVVLGTSLFASFFRYAGGSLGYLSAGQVNEFYFIVLVIGGGIGSIIGARIVLGNGLGSRDILIKMVQVAILLFISYEFLIRYLIFGH